ncbi:phosphoglucomutase/phosphomannomutase family protein [Pyrinomonas methylaliphatogenes]|uniref:Phosphomannomutase n=1 Tax=Pyrinomonas methylaliphatogenes TaxID=454194 RepID=A0A0B6WYE6_9BACT|nr:phosphoglucomutase/phosphomannomutase family protein [Pyrinomonas methylaliphatogenes]CDM65329.1 phosphomannomutase [Pyrinomonas methylaliphatogenes]
MSEKTERAPIRFGTDGWRAVIAREFTFANVARVAQAYADYLLEESAQREMTARAEARQTEKLPLAVVGYDRRFLSEHFAHLTAEVLTANRIRVFLFERDMPTPVISWAVRDRKADGGVVITASHNPPEFNGFKIKAPWGGSATPETTSAVEALVDRHEPRREEYVPQGREELEQAVANYRVQIESYVDLDRLRALRARIIVDPMHGTGARWVESFLRGGALEVETIRPDRDPLFGGVNPEPIDQNLGPLKERVKETGALVGLATDGDADRVGAVNELGQTMTMHEVVPLVLLHLARHRRMTGGVVRTFSQSVLLKRIADAHGLKLYDTPIGFKYIADLMLREDILLGAEESGGIGVKGHIPERDGILNSLLFLEAIATAGKPPSEMVRDLHREFGEFYFGRRDLHMEVSRGKALVAELAEKTPAEVASYRVESISTMDGTKLIFNDESWLLFRQSGTEPVLRIYAEATSVEKMNALLDEGCAIAQAPRAVKA